LHLLLSTFDLCFVGIASKPDITETKFRLLLFVACLATKLGKQVLIGKDMTIRAIQSPYAWDGHYFIV
jgi:hypothetical protein